MLAELVTCAREEVLLSGSHSRGHRSVEMVTSDSWDVGVRILISACQHFYQRSSPAPCPGSIRTHGVERE